MLRNTIAKGLEKKAIDAHYEELKEIEKTKRIPILSVYFKNRSEKPFSKDALMK
jgi:hypothetical protein